VGPPRQERVAVRQADRRQRLANRRHPLGGRPDTLHVERLTHDLGHRQARADRVERVLRDELHLLAHVFQGRAGEAVEGLPFERDRAALRVEHPGHQPPQRGLAAARLADHGHDLAFQHVERRIAHRLHAEAVAVERERLGQPVDAQQGLQAAQVARDQPVAHRLQRRVDPAALVHRLGAARVKTAPGWRVGRVRQAPAHAAQIARGGHVGIGVEQAPRVGMARALEHVAGRADLGQLARVEHGDPIRQPRDGGQIVRDQQQAGPAVSAHPIQEREQGGAGEHVLAAGWLVHDQDVRRAAQGHRQHQPLLLAAAELVRVRPQVALAQAQLRGEIERPRPRVAIRQAQVLAHRLGDLVAEALHRVESCPGVLHRQRDAPPADRPPPLLVQRDQLGPVQSDAARHRARRVQAQQRARQRGLAAAGLAHERQRLPRRQIERDAVHRPDRGARIVRRGEGHAQVLDGQQGSGHGRFNLGSSRCSSPMPSRFRARINTVTHRPGGSSHHSQRSLNSRPGRLSA